MWLRASDLLCAAKHGTQRDSLHAGAFLLMILPLFPRARGRSLLPTSDEVTLEKPSTSRHRCEMVRVLSSVDFWRKTTSIATVIRSPIWRYPINHVALPKIQSSSQLHATRLLYTRVALVESQLFVCRRYHAKVLPKHRHSAASTIFVSREIGEPVPGSS